MATVSPLFVNAHPKGSHWFLSGGRTEVEIVEEGKPQSKCKILAVAPGSKTYAGKVGQVVNINNRVLYPFLGKSVKH
jgi:hypothetical protein